MPFRLPALIASVVAVTLGWSLPLAAQPAGAPPVVHPPRAWTLPALDAWTELTPAPDGGVLVSACDDDASGQDLVRVSADGTERVAYPDDRFVCSNGAAVARNLSAYVNGYRSAYWGVQARRPDGSVRWTHMFGEDAEPLDVPVLVDGHLWVALFGSYGLSQLAELDRATGQRVASGGYFSSQLPILATPEGPVVVERGIGEVAEPAQVSWLDHTGATTQTATLPLEASNWRARAGVGPDRAVFVAGCFHDPLRVEMRSPTGGAWTWSAPAGEQCADPQLTATSDGGVVVGRGATASADPDDGIATYTKLDATGIELWTHIVTSSPGRLVRSSQVVPPTVTAANQVMVGATVSNVCRAGRCRHGFLEVLDVDGSLLERLATPPLRHRFPHGTSLTGLALGGDQIYVVLSTAHRHVALSLRVMQTVP